MDIVLGLHQRFLEQEVEFQEAGVLLLEGEDGFVDGGQSQDCGNAFSLYAGDAEVQHGGLTGEVALLVRIDGDGQVTRRIDDDQAGVALDLPPLRDGIGVQLQRPVEVWRQIDLDLGAAVFRLECARRDGLPFADDVQIE